MSVSTMKKLTVLAYASDADAIVRKLMHLRCVEVRNALSEEGLAPIDTLRIDEQKATAERRLTDIKRALPYLAKYVQRKGLFGRGVHRVNRNEFCLDGRDKRAWKTVEDTLETVARTESLTAEKTRNEALLDALEPWLSYDAPLNEEGSQKTLLMLGSVNRNVRPSELRMALEQEDAYMEEIESDERNVYLSVTCMREDEERIGRILTSYGFLRTTFPEIATTAHAAYTEADQMLDRIDSDLLAMEERLRDLAENIDDVEILCDIEATTVNVCLQKRKLAATHRCVVLQGWFPSVTEDAIVDALSKFECACEVAEPTEEDEPPVLLKNNAWAANFEWVIGMYSYPKYGTFDPTLIMSIFYFIIFGLMFADVGYGLLLAACCFGGVKLLHLKPGMRRMLSMFGLCGISCAVMGVLFGGWFGNLPTAIMNSFIYHESGAAEATPLGHFFANGLIFNPISASTSFLVLSLAVGEIHLIAGMAINMIESCKKGKVLEGICSTVPFWVLFAGIDLMAPGIVVDMLVTDPAAISEAQKELFALLSTIGKYMMFTSFGLILFLTGVGQKGFVKWITKGLGGLYSLISFASDLLSYSRILALGLVAGVIAQVINMLTDLGAGSVVGFIFMLIVMIVGHVLNLAINLLGTFVHAARLQYIEFFGKFYEDGGVPFDPALPAEEYSEDVSNVTN